MGADAAGAVRAARLDRRELRVLQSYPERWGRPVAFYTDQAGLFQVHRPARREEELAGQEARTQMGRALEELGIAWIATLRLRSGR